MKRLISAAALAAIMICSCQKAGQDAPFTGETKVTIKVSGGASDLTKTVMERNSADNGYEFFWEEGDEISIIEKNSALEPAYIAIDDECSTFETEFEMVFPYDPEELASTPLDFVAFYPQDAYRNERGTEKVYIPSLQYIPAPGKFDPDADLLISHVETTGVPDKLTFNFNRIGAIVRMTLTHLPAQMDIDNIYLEFDKPVSDFATLNMSDMTYEADYPYITLAGVDRSPLGTTDSNGCITVFFRTFAAEISTISISTGQYFNRIVDISEYRGAEPIVFPEGGMASFTVDMRTVTGITFESEPPTAMTTGQSLAMEAIPVPANAICDIQWKTSDEDVVNVTEDGRLRAISAGSATITAYVGDEGCPLAESSFTVEVSLGPVDLGLPSGIIWASCNLGASSPEEFGDYYAWGETETKEFYNILNYKYCKGEPCTFTKYVTQANAYSSSYNHTFYDNHKVLLAMDDAANAVLGGTWCIPSKDDWQELIDHCDCLYTTRKGINGLEVISKINGNSIFLPAAGIWFGTDGDRTKPDPSRGFKNGWYWSSLLACEGIIDSDAWSFTFYEFSLENVVYFDQRYRAEGLPVRPIDKGYVFN